MLGHRVTYTNITMRELVSQECLWDLIQTLREHKCQPRILYPVKLSITIAEENKILHDKTKFAQYLPTNPALQKIINEKL